MTRAKPIQRRTAAVMQEGAWGILVALLMWVLTSGHVRAQVLPGTALRFDGATTWLSAGAQPSFNAFPLTVTAWIRTTNTDVEARGVVGNYADSSFNGYSLFLQQGRLRGWYFANFFSYVWDGALGMDGGFVADGGWHHVAMVVDPSGGRLYVDGTLTASRSWAGFPGPASSPAPFQLGRYSTYAAKFDGDLDEASLWSVGLDAATINYLKHRRLSGRETGLLGLWRMDEGAGGTVANEAGTGLGPGPSLNLEGDPEWVPSTAPIGFSMVANRALRLDGTQTVELPAVEEHNTLPFAVMAWVKTSQKTGAWPAMVSKYRGNSLNGWALALNAGRVAPWYYADSTHYVEPPLASATDRFVADDQWHHVAFLVDESGARIFIDGAPVSSTPWVGGARRVTSGEPLRLGNYPVTGVPYVGEIDEISIWNQLPTPSEVQRYSRSRLTGAEPGLVTFYSCDEEPGTALGDLTGLASGVQVDGWRSVGSMARLSDGTQWVRAAAWMDRVAKDWALRGAKDGLGYLFPSRVQVWALHDRSASPGQAQVDLESTVTLTKTAAGSSVDLSSSSAATRRTLAFVDANLAFSAGSRLDLPLVINAVPSESEQIDSVNETVGGLESLTMAVDGEAPVVVESRVVPDRRLIHLNGLLKFGDVTAGYASLALPPAAGAVIPPDALTVSLALPANGAWVTSQPSLTFGGGPPLTGLLQVDGTVVVTIGSYNINLNSAGLVAQGIRYGGGVRLSPSGALATVLGPYLPLGLGVSGNTNQHLQYPAVAKQNVPLKPDFLPVDDPVIFTAADMGFPVLCFSEETKPLWFLAPAVEWRVQEGTLVLPTVDQAVWVRESADARLESFANRLEDTNMIRRISNDQYYRAARVVAGSAVTFRADADGRAVVSAELDLGAIDLRPHFPYVSNRVETRIAIGSGRMTLQDDLPVRSASYVSLAESSMPVDYARDCTDAACALADIGTARLEFTPDSGFLYFSVDGGLTADGTVPAQNVTWGHIEGDKYAHRTADVSAGTYEMAGTFLRGDMTSQEDGRKPAVMLLSGFGRPGDEEYVERPGTLGYRDGFANYAGLNFRDVPGARSILGGQDTGEYPLRARSKYYVRPSGVAGIHEASTFPAGMRLAGYDFKLSGLLLSFLNSQVEESRTDGTITLPAPAGFVQEFAELRFHCRGTLASAKIPGTSGDKTLVYWPATITPRSLWFAANPSVLCANPGESFLVLGCDIRVDSLPEKLFGRLGFERDGHLVTGTNANAQGTGVDSRFAPPAAVSLAGPGTSAYLFSTVSEAYFNNARVFPASSWGARNGFVNLAGKVDLPLFEDMPVHLHLKSGGKRAVDIARGWVEGGKDYFSDPKFDRAQIGFQGASLNDYRTAAGTRPVARKNWLGFILFDYPVAYSPLDGVFTSASKTSDELLVLNVENRVKRMTPTQAELKFGVEAGLPDISVGNLGYSAVEGITGAGDALNKALGSAAGGVLSAGLDSLNGLLADALNTALDRVISDGLKDPLNQLAGGLAQAYEVSPNYAAFSVALKDLPKTYLGAPLGQALQPGQRAFQEVQKALDQAIAGVDVAVDLLHPATRSVRVRNLAIELLKKETSLPAPVLSLAVRPEVLDPLFRDVDPTLNEIRAQFLEIRRRLSDLRNQTGSGFGEFAGVAATEPLKLLQKMGGDLLAYVPEAEFADRRFVVERGADRISADLRKRLSDAVWASEIPRAFQTAIKQRLYDVQAELQTALGGVFQMVNGVVREAVVKAGQPLDNAVKDFLGSNLKDVAAAAKLVGVAEINGDSIRRIRLDASLRLKIPDDFGFNGYLEIRELSSENTPAGCLDGYDKATEVSMGATDVTLGWIAKDLRADLGGKFIFQAAGSGFRPVGMSGYTMIRGKVEMGGLEVKELGAALAFGEEENYLAARVRAEFNSKEVAAGFFIGRTCFPDPLFITDPDVAKTLPMGRLPLTGGYLYGEGWFPLNEVLGIPSSCVFNIRAGAGQGAFFFVDGTGLPIVGAKYTYGLSGQILCVLGVQGELRIIGSIPGLKKDDLIRLASLDLGSLPRLTLRGVGKVSAEIGYCPFCLSFSKEIGLTIRNASPLLILTSVGGPAVVPFALADTLLNIGDLEYEVDF